MSTYPVCKLSTLYHEGSGTRKDEATEEGKGSLIEQGLGEGKRRWWPHPRRAWQVERGRLLSCWEDYLVAGLVVVSGLWQ